MRNRYNTNGLCEETWKMKNIIQWLLLFIILYFIVWEIILIYYWLIFVL